MPPKPLKRPNLLALRSKGTSKENQGTSGANTAITAEDLLEAARKVNFEVEKDIVKFQKDFELGLSNPVNNEAKEKPALHILAAYINKTELSKYELFLRWVCQKRPELLHCKYLSFPPIHSAIQAKNTEFIRIVLESAPDSNTLFTPADDKNMTCLHFAIQEESVLSGAIIARAKELRKTAGKDDINVFLAKTWNKKQTPLHCAVAQALDDEEYDTEDTEILHQTQTTMTILDSILHEASISDRQVPRVETLLGSVPSGMEVYGSPVQTNGVLRRAPDLFPDEAVAIDSSALKISREKKDLARSTSFKPTSDGQARHQDIPRYRVGEIIRSLIDAMGEALLEEDIDNNTPYQAIVKELEGSVGELVESRFAKRVEEEEKPQCYQYVLRTLLEDPRAKMVRTYCVEQLSRKNALKALYKVGEERVIEFDLSQMLYSPIDADFLNGLEKVLHFENILSYIALPRLSVQEDKEMQSYLEAMEEVNARYEKLLYPEPSLPGGEAKDVAQENTDQNSKAKGKFPEEKENSDKEGIGTKGKGLTSLCPIFRWLRNLHVSAIIKVTVIDDVEPSHSDAAIENCLQGFDIETWNWKKFDICSEVIYNSAPNVKEVILYSSGNNAVLLGWSSSAGLKKLRKLKSVSIIVREGLESTNRVKQYMWEFEQAIRRHQNLKKIQFGWKRDDPKNSFASTFIDKAIIPEDNLWLVYMKNFAQFLKNAQPRAEPVKIAIIDDGINTALGIFENRIHSGDSFYDPTLDSFHGRRGVYYVPSGRHGTLMAQLICDICPVVKLFIAQLQATPGKEQQRSFSTQSAVDAVEWAVARKVDIISMSWSIEDGPGTGALNVALGKAQAAGILMFCSCIDRGASAADNTYPGKSNCCIKIGAATASGEKLPWVSGDKSEFLLPGENVQPAEADAWSHSQSGPFGSSIATALAAGLAGVLLYCNRLIGCETTASTQDAGEVEELRDTGNMRNAFKSMAPRDNFVEVRNSLEPLFKNPQDIVWNKKKAGSGKVMRDLELFMAGRKGLR